MAVCEICGSQNFELITTHIREGESRICKCQKCGLVIQDLPMSEHELKEYYNDAYQKTNSLTAGREQTARERFADRLQTIDPVYRRVLPYLRKDMSVLEVGCGAGELLYRIQPQVREVAGIELNSGFVDFINNDLGITAWAQDINKINFNGRKFDFIVSVATLDHLPNPLETLLTMKRLLSEKGEMFIIVPNRDEALNFFIPGENQAKFNTFFWHKAHMFYFTAETIEMMLNKAGFGVTVTSMHQYSMMNFLHWYFTGTPQKGSVGAVTGIRPFIGNSDYEIRMNEMFEEMELRFHRIMDETMRGDFLCCHSVLKS